MKIFEYKIFHLHPHPLPSSVCQPVLGTSPPLPSLLLSAELLVTLIHHITIKELHHSRNYAI